MERAPDMDDLLDELEENGNQPKLSKASESSFGHSIVIDLPVHLRKLSEKDSIRMDLYPLASITSKVIDEKNEANLCSVVLPTDAMNTEKEIPVEVPQVTNGDCSDEAESKEVGESLELDSEYEEVLKYLEKFHDTVSIREHMSTGVGIEVTSGLSNFSSCAGNESLQDAAETIAEAVLDAIINKIEDGLEISLKRNIEGTGNVEESTGNRTTDFTESTSLCVDDVHANDEASCGNKNDNVVQNENAMATPTPLNDEMVGNPMPVSTNSSPVIMMMQKPVLALHSGEQLEIKKNRTTRKNKIKSEDSEKSEKVVQMVDEVGNVDCETVLPKSSPLLTVIEAKDSKCAIDNMEEIGGTVPGTMNGNKFVRLCEEGDVADAPDQYQQSREYVETAREDISSKVCVPTERTEPEENICGLEAATECETVEHNLPAAEPCDRLDAPVIATIHDLSQESDSMRLTESELQLGKSKPYWIPDDDCAVCMLCSSKFSLLNRRHHCRACGRVACGSCCKERAVLHYMKDDPKKQTQARVCSPCASMLARIEQYEKTLKESAERNSDDSLPSTSAGNRVARGVLKTRTPKATDVESESSQTSDTVERKRSVVFRDGVKPGAMTPVNGVEFGAEEKNTTVKPKKKSRKRQEVTRRVVELRLEDELGCALPTPSRPKFLITNTNGEMDMVDEEFITTSLKEGLSVTVVLKKNLACVARICEVDSMSVFCVHSCGFASIGLDEVLFVWERIDLTDFSLPLNVLHRIAQIYSTSCDTDQAGVRQVCTRLPAIHSVPIALPPLTRHILFFPPTLQDFTSLIIPSSPFLIALFLHDAELSWAMACPNRLLFRLGLKYKALKHVFLGYPTPIANILGRDSVYSTETSQTVLKVFTDFHSWSFRMKHLVGCTATLSNDVTLVEIPKSAKNDLNEILSLNRTVIAWATSVNLSADSHLVCDETDGLYSTQVFARGSTRLATGTSFVIIDGGLKNSGIQISVVEDGVSIRIPSEKLKSLLDSLENMQDWSTCDSSGCQFSVRWIDSSLQSTQHGANSSIDGINLSNKFQYGLSLERAISSVLQVSSVADYGVRLSHVYNLKDGRLSPDDEPKVFSIAEMLARECTVMLEPYLPMLINMNIMCTSIRVCVNAEKVEYDVSPWFGMEEQQMLYKWNMDQLIPVLYDILRYLSGGFHIELTLSFVLTKSLPI